MATKKTGTAVAVKKTSTAVANIQDMLRKQAEANASRVEPGPAMGRKHRFVPPQMGHLQSSGKSANFTPAGILPFLSPLSGLYM